MLAALGSIATQQAIPTANTMRKIKQLLDYAATHTDAAVTYWSRNIVMAAHSDAYYLLDTRHEAAQGDISSWPGTSLSPKTTEPFTQSPK